MTATVFVDYYELLEVHPRASEAEIKAAYRACMVRDHADQNPDDIEAKERMILLTRAKQTLLDEPRRMIFDRERARWHAAAQIGMAPPRWTGGQAPTSDFTNPNEREHRVEVDLRDVSIGRLLVGVGVAAFVTGLGLAAKAVADRANRKRRRPR
ncbi:Chaperone protein DnaJ [Enhygromyxa salina]|uniref:Chaperone protein DnaJ n=1 Tax=Enhygromyxa salina TaxID=215803 RepID=A0A2S9YCY2_9BACT|nr:DnaJ domain-containing protein [Enhygromyxa salina]PRQ02902.1 Chaperone protein DnaJ [Enhygromyxa salina]